MTSTNLEENQIKLDNLITLYNNITTTAEYFKPLSGDIEVLFASTFTTLMFNNIYGDASGIKTNMTEELFNKLSLDGSLDKLQDGTKIVLDKLGYDVQLGSKKIGIYKSYVLTDEKILVLYDDSDLEDVMGEKLYNECLISFIDEQVKLYSSKCKELLKGGLDYENIGYGTIYSYGPEFSILMESMKHIDGTLFEDIVESTFIQDLSIYSNIKDCEIHPYMRLEIRNMGSKNVSPDFTFNDVRMPDVLDKATRHDKIFLEVLKLDGEETSLELKNKVRSANAYAYSEILGLKEPACPNGFDLATNLSNWLNAYYTI